MSGTALYARDGSRWTPRPEARGPFPGQHGGAVGGALAAAMTAEAEAADAGVGLQFVMYLLRPAPVAPVEIAVETVRAGGRTTLFRAEMTADGRACAFAHMLFVRPSRVAGLPELDPRPGDPEAAAPYEIGYPAGGAWFWDTVEARRADDGMVWMRPRIPVVADASPTVQLIAFADWAPGLSRPDSAEAPRVAGFPNAELSIHLWRPPRDAWIGLKATSEWYGNGMGQSQAALFDAHGAVGRSSQSIVLLPLEGQGEG